jgi:hypothetical protein
VRDVRIFKDTDDVQNGVDFADMRQELIAHAFAVARALDQSRDVDKRDRGRDLFGGVVHALQGRQTRVGDGHDPDVRIDGAKRVVGHVGAGPRQCVE